MFSFGGTTAPTRMKLLIITDYGKDDVNDGNLLQIMTRMIRMMATVRSIADCSRIKASVAGEASAASAMVAQIFANNALSIKNSPATPGGAEMTTICMFSTF